MELSLLAMDEYKKRIKPLVYKTNFLDDWPEWNRPWVGRIIILSGFFAFFWWVEWPFFEPYAYSDIVLNGIVLGVFLFLFMAASITLAAIIDANIFKQ